MAKKPQLTETQQDIFGDNYVLHFTEEELTGGDEDQSGGRGTKAGWFRRPLTGDELADPTWGGHQLLGKKLQLREAGGHLFITGSELVEVYTKWLAYGNGGYQKFYWRPTVAAATRAGWQPSPELVAYVASRRYAVLARGHQSAVE